jgi:hypothetical protein
MNITFKTLILAAAGAALIAVSPASAQTNKRAQTHRTPAPAVQNVAPQQQPGLEQWEQGEVNESASVDTYGQIRDEYLKDGPSHNGNGY